MNLQDPVENGFNVILLENIKKTMERWELYNWMGKFIL